MGTHSLLSQSPCNRSTVFDAAFTGTHESKRADSMAAFNPLIALHIFNASNNSLLPSHAPSSKQILLKHGNPSYAAASTAITLAPPSPAEHCHVLPPDNRIKIHKRVPVFVSGSLPSTLFCSGSPHPSPILRVRTSAPAAPLPAPLPGDPAPDFAGRDSTKLAHARVRSWDEERWRDQNGNWHARSRYNDVGVG